MTLRAQLEALAYRVREQQNPMSVGNILEVTSFESGPAHAMTCYVPVDATIDEALAIIEKKRRQFIALDKDFARETAQRVENLIRERNN